MSTPAARDTSLDDIRQEIDGIDDSILDLVARRLQASEKVRSHKSGNGSLVSSPIRPAREAMILRRLLERGGVPPELLVRLWRVILTSSTLFQAAVTLHIPRKLASQMGLRLRLRDHFGALPVEEYRDEAQALLQVNMNSGDICAVEAASAWADAFAEGGAGEARIIGVLPVLRTASVPEVLIFGHAQALATGDDETVIVSEGKLPRDFLPKPLWQLKSGSRRISSLPGFLSEHEAPLIGLVRSNAALGVKVAGRYPSPIEVSP
ncbi:MAG: chorismate mutase [Rhizobiales bacterium]|nr:chorismate mutase [Hyphomicrobiales bacterium]